MRKKGIYFVATLLILTMVIHSQAWEQDEDLTGPCNQFPHAVACADPWGYTGITNQDITLDGSASYDNDEGDYIANYSWNLGNGWTAWSSSPTIIYSNQNGGNYSIWLRVMDSHDAISLPDESFVNINPSGSALDIVIADQHPIIGWRKGQDVIFDLEVENIYYPDIWWFDIELNVRNQLKPVTPEEYHVRFTHGNPLVFDENWLENPTWSSLHTGLYTIDAVIDWGAGTDSDWDIFWIHI